MKIFLMIICTLLLFINILNSNNKTMILELEGNKTYYNDGYISYCSNCLTKRTQYTRYSFRKVHFKKLLGDPKKIKRAKIKIQIYKTINRTYFLKSESMHKGSGSTIHETINLCKIIKIIYINHNNDN